MYSWGCATSGIWVGLGSSPEPYGLFTAGVVLPALSGPVPAANIGYTWELGDGIGLNDLSGSVYTDLGKRDVCTTGIVLQQVFGSIYAVGMGNKHLCTTGVCATAGIWVDISSRLEAYAPMYSWRFAT